MRFTSIALIFCTLIACIYGAHASGFIVVGKNEDGQCTKTAFVLTLEEDALENVRISESGEIYLKADRIVAIPKDQSFPSAYRGALGEDSAQCGSRVSPPPRMWQCPYCLYWWEIGEMCTNKDCPTNQWKKKQ